MGKKFCVSEVGVCAVVRERGDGRGEMGVRKTG